MAVMAKVKKWNIFVANFTTLPCQCMYAVHYRASNGRLVNETRKGMVLEGIRRDVIEELFQNIPREIERKISISIARVPVEIRIQYVSNTCLDRTL